MKKTLRAVIALGLVAVVSGCASPFPSGALVYQANLPMESQREVGNATKTGVAKCTSILALVAQGDCTIKAAVEDGNIEKVHYMDWHTESILGIIGKYELRVYGE